MKIFIFSIFVTSISPYQTQAGFSMPFYNKENFLIFGDSLIYWTNGGVNLLGCGAGCLKCDS